MYVNTYICMQEYTCLHMYVYIHRARSYDILWKRIWKDYTWRNKSIPYMHSYIRNRKMTETLEQINVLIWADNFWELWNSWPNLSQHNYPECQNIDYLVWMSCLGYSSSKWRQVLWDRCHNSHFRNLYECHLLFIFFFAEYWDFKSIASSSIYYLCHIVGNTKPVNLKPQFRTQLKYLILQNSSV